jgi:carotenoid cleavage dioxygenase
MVHAVYLKDGRARYRNRWVLTDELAQERAAGRRLFNSTFSPPPYANLANTSVARHAGRILALYEGGAPYELDREAGTVGRFDYGGKLPGVMSAHPKIDPRTGELLSVQYDLEACRLIYMRADAQGRLDRVVVFDAPWRAMVHDIAITETHVVAFICPLVFDLSGQGPPAAWQPERGSMVALIPRDCKSPADVSWIPAGAFFHWHTVNAFEEEGRIEVTMPWYDNFSLDGSARKLELHRLVIDPAAKTVQDIALDGTPCEFGRINDAFLGRKARFGYLGLRLPRPGESSQPGTFEAVARYDLRSGERQAYLLAPGMSMCEPVFVPNPGGSREDDGYIVAFVHDEGSPGGLFIMLDARNLEAGPVATVMLPRRVPAGLHGAWMPD